MLAAQDSAVLQRLQQLVEVEVTLTKARLAIDAAALRWKTRRAGAPPDTPDRRPTLWTR